MYYILLGKSADLAYAEVCALARRFGYSAPTRLSLYICSIDDLEDPQGFLAASGSIVKVFERISNRPEIDSIVADLLAKQEDHFAISTFQRSVDGKLIANRIKDGLKNEGIKPHFRLLIDPYESAGITTKTTEYCINDIKDVPAILKTVASQDLYAWRERDYGRPAIDPHSGMMPPKIARTMINLGLTSLSPETVIYDPFCGSGTILTEGLSLGCAIIGSDLSKKAVNASRANCDWYAKKHQLTNQYTVFEKDATHVSLADIKASVNAIVFEGYLGPPSPDPKRVPDLVKGMQKLYRGVFKQLYPLLQPNGYLVCALPEFMLSAGVKNLDEVIDWTESLGYTRCGRFTYGRPQATVKRAIYVLQKIAK